jgi:hypothetical protein
MQTLRQCQPVGLCLGQKLVEIPFEGSTKAMAQSSASNVTPIHSGGILTAGLVAPNFTLHVTSVVIGEASDLRILSAIAFLTVGATCSITATRA